MSRGSKDERSLDPSASDGLFEALPIRLPAPDGIVASRIPSAGPHHTPRPLTAAQREVFRQTAARSRLAKARAMRGQGPEPRHEINKPLLRATDLMPQLADNRLRALSLFSGGGGLDIGFEQGGLPARGQLRDPVRCRCDPREGSPGLGGPRRLRRRRHQR